MKKFVLCLLCLLMMGSLISCGILIPNMDAEETFTVDGFSDGIFSITLTGNFQQQDFLASLGSCSAFYDSSKAKVMIMTRDAEDYEYSFGSVNHLLSMGDSAAMGYAKMMIDTLEASCEPVYDEEHDIVWYQYDSSFFGQDFSGVCYIYQHEDALWIVDMVCRPDDFAEMQPYFEEWAFSVTIV